MPGSPLSRRLLACLALLLLSLLPTLAARHAQAEATAVTAPAGWTPPAVPVLPRAGLEPADLGLLVAEGDPLSEAAALAYQRARGIPDANVVRLPVPAGSDVISDADFATLKQLVDARLPARVQATLVTWMQPSRVAGTQGATCTTSITSALAFGHNPVLCGGCARTQPSAYYDTDTTRPYADLRIRPSMLLGAPTVEAAQALIDRGLAAEGSQPVGSGWLVRTSDAARSSRWPDWPALPGLWSQAPGLALRFLDGSAPGSPQQPPAGQQDVLFYFTGIVRPDQLPAVQFLPGAVADHLTSFGGHLPGGRGQLVATAWLAAGATASYGTVEEPCNHPQKFPQASVLLEHYLRGATVLEAYWKSVAWPGQGLFVGDPLARPWAHVPTATVEGRTLVVRSRALRRLTSYQVELQPAGSSSWRVIGSLSAGQPRPVVWRLPLPDDASGGRLRWLGPCPLRPMDRCVLAEG